MALLGSNAMASSHREGPFTAMQRTIDGTDFYMFRSYETGKQDTVTLLANYIPFQDPEGGPNFYQFDPDALYEIHIDNDGDAKEDLTFQFRFKSTSKKTALPIGGKQVLIPLINSGRIDATNSPALNVRETYTVDLVRGGRRSGTRERLTNAANGSDTFDKPVDYVGEKTFGSFQGYETYADRHIYTVQIPGCGNGRVFVGQRQESFYIAVGEIFDLVNLNPLGPEVNGNTNDLERKNISTLALEVPTSCLTTGSDPVIGGYTSASLRQVRLLDPDPGTSIDNASLSAGAWSQVSRLGMPLVNELVIGLDDKDRFNSSRPSGDATFLDYVANPTLPAIVESLFPAAKAPTNFPRTDLVAAFLTGIEGVNKPRTVVPSEMLRLNTSIPPTPIDRQNPLGVAANDLAGFPNGRRPADDVVDLSLRVAMGALCVLTGANDALKVGCRPSDAPAGGLAVTDGVRKTAVFPNFWPRFPYLLAPLPGAVNR
ncbi:MAG: DUF4331 domain-containing protein [Burkholderiaceae bacterium]